MFFNYIYSTLNCRYLRPDLLRYLSIPVASLHPRNINSLLLLFPTIDSYLDFSKVNCNKMALSLKPSGGFAALPREIRDMICEQIAAAAGIHVDLCGCSSLDLYDIEFAGCIKMLHEWAPKSSVAKAAYEAILSAANYRGDWTCESKVIIDPTTPLIMGRRGPNGGVDVSSGTMIDLRDCVRDIGLDVEMTRHLPSYADKEDQENLLRLERELTQLCQLPRLRRFRLTVWIPCYGDAYHRPMLFFASMSSAIKQLRKRVEGNISVSICRDFILDQEPFDFIDPYNVNWMWDPSSFASAEHAKTSLAAVERRMKRLIADGVDPNGAFTLVEELRTTANALPQNKGDVVNMDDWSVGTGITKEKWLKIRKTWKRPS